MGPGFCCASLFGAVEIAALRREAQSHLRRLPHLACGAADPRPEPVLAPQVLEAYGNFLAIGFRRISTETVPLVIPLHQLWEFLLEERQKLFKRSRHQEQHIATEPLRAGIARRSRQCIEVLFTVRQSWQYRRNKQTRRDPRLVQFAHRLEPQIGSWRSRF